jgi:hypothetical protein
MGSSRGRLFVSRQALASPADGHGVLDHADSSQNVFLVLGSDGLEELYDLAQCGGVIGHGLVEIDCFEIVLELFWKLYGV